MKLEKSSLVASHYFTALFVLVLRALLDIDGVEGITALIICVRINNQFMLSKIDASAADDEVSESFLSLSLLIATTKRISPF